MAKVGIIVGPYKVLVVSVFPLKESRSHVVCQGHPSLLNGQASLSPPLVTWPDALDNMSNNEIHISELHTYHVQACANHPTRGGTEGVKAFLLCLCM